MKITRLRTNNLENPIGYYMDPVMLSYQVSEARGTKSIAQRIEIAEEPDFSRLYFDSGKQYGIDSKGYTPPINFKKSVRYYWRVTVWDESGDKGTSDSAFFEMPPEKIYGKWITAPFSDKHAVFMKKWNMKEYVITENEETIKDARLYICGLGVYEAFVNGQRVGKELLAPFYNDYNHWIQFQSYDITPLLQEGENALGVMLGNGWYCGRFSPLGWVDKLYGDQQILVCDIVIKTTAGRVIRILSDESFVCRESPVLESSIYDGEVYDSRKNIEDFSKPSCHTECWQTAVFAKPPVGKLQARRSLPLLLHEEIKPVDVIQTPEGEKVLDFGQNLTGVLKFKDRALEGTRLWFQFGECLQNGNFYNENLRSAKQELVYYSDGKGRMFCPHFTFYGFRYVKISGIEEIIPEDYTACVLYSDMEQTGFIQTSDKKINRLFQNIMWGQKGNFVDVPTDCPQRDERLGWTGDAQIFSAAACFNMYVPGFFNKYLYDMCMEQKEAENKGAVPYVVPDILTQTYRIWREKNIDSENHVTSGSSAWGDAATVIPWTLYLFYGNKEYLEKQYEGMKLWVEYIYRMDEERCQGRRLWTCGFHFGDWLALDNFHQDSRMGGTDPNFIASAFYLYSAELTAKAADALGIKEDAQRYYTLAKEVRQAMQKEYFTATGRLAVNTQTAMALALHFHIVPSEFLRRIVQDLKNMLEQEKIHLTTGFVGTAYLCNTLSENGLSEYAYTLLLNEDYPSWLYEVNMGATTVWERWNSIMPDGSIIKGSEMNSLNHYSYGAVVEWMYRWMCGLNPVESAPGFQQFILCPQPDNRLSYVKMSYESPYGKIVSEWEKRDGGWRFIFCIPFDTTAEFVVPNLSKKRMKLSKNGKIFLVEAGERIRLEPGEYVIDLNIDK